jgi:hypothetical protein
LVESSWGLAHRMSLTDLALLDGRRPLPLWDVIGLTLTLTLNLTFNLHVKYITYSICRILGFHSGDYISVLGSVSLSSLSEAIDV